MVNIAILPRQQTVICYHWQNASIPSHPKRYVVPNLVMFETADVSTVPNKSIMYGGISRRKAFSIQSKRTYIIPEIGLL